MLFNEIVREKLLIAAESYSLLLNKKIIISVNEINRKYVINFFKSNFLHLTGVKTNLKAEEFYIKCLYKKITINDFNFFNNEIIKIYSIKKLKHLIYISSFFNRNLLIQQSFKKGSIRSAFALSNRFCTIGFVRIKNTYVPQTILDRNYLNKNNSIYTAKVSIK